MKTKLFNDNWFFCKTDLNGTIDVCDFKPVEIPHDFLIYNTKNLYENSVGWYKKEFNLSDFDKNLEDYLIRFDGVYMDSTIYLNGKLVGEWKYGYSTFEVDLTKEMEEKNTLIVRVVHQSPNSRWYSGAGIYRNVYFKRKAKSHILSDSLYIHTQEKENNLWELKVDSKIKNAENIDNILIKLSLNNETVFEHSTGSDSDLKEVLSISNPKIWDIDTPENLYKLRVSLIKNNEVVDYQETTLGFRTIVFDLDNGFILNGRKVPLQGVCQHHDLGGLGAAFNKKALKRQLSILKEMGTNAIRTAHNMPAKELMELADEMGILICSEALDMWESSKTPYDYGRFFDQWVEKDFESWINRDRNHPSLIMWSIGNEIHDTHASLHGVDITKRLVALVEKYDYYGNAVSTIGSNYMLWDNAPKCADVVKFAGYNYAEQLYNPHHEKYPDWYIYGSETSSVVQSRGIYHFPLKKSVLSDDDEQCSALGNSSTSWGAKSMEAVIINHRQPHVLGQFIWTGTDYIGEPTPYQTKNSYFGQIDTAGFKKDSFYFYQAEWTNYKTNPMIHIFPYWDFSNGQKIDIRVCSNAPKIELYLNDKLIGSENIDHTNGTKLIPSWTIPYESGTLKAIAYDENNNVIAEDIQKSYGNGVKLSLNTLDTQVLADGKDLAFIEINVLDENGTVVQNANNRVEVNVTGCGRLIALDNGDSTDFEQYKGTSRRLFSGKLLAIVAPTYESGEINITVSSPNLPSEKLVIQSNKSDLTINNTLGHSNYLDSNKESEQITEIPVRKIELILERNLLNSVESTTLVTAKIHPDNATYKEVQWRLTNEAGIDSNIATFEVVGENQILVKGLSDGEAFVRCSTKNGRDKTNLYSLIELTLEDLGSNYFDPYSFISAGLYTKSNVELTNGNDRGVATLRSGESHVIFENINFGDFGSNAFDIDIFAMDQEAFEFEVWVGNPEEKDSEKLATLSYDLGSKWNVYKTVRYTLPKRLSGIQTIAFVITRKIHIKGFTFVKQNKAYEKLYVSTDKNSIYGDTFTLTNDFIKGIGNNVTIGFENMNFKEKAVSKITICGQTPIDINTIQIRCTSENGVIIEELPFTKSNDFKEMTFDFPELNEVYDIDFIFLPGSNFNFQWFMFE